MDKKLKHHYLSSQHGHICRQFGLLVELPNQVNERFEQVVDDLAKPVEAKAQQIQAYRGGVHTTQLVDGVELDQTGVILDVLTGQGGIDQKCLGEGMLPHTTLAECALTNRLAHLHWRKSHHQIFEIIEMTVDTAAEPITRDRLEHSVEGRPFPARGNFPSMRNCPPMIVTRAAIHAVRDHPYAAIGIAVGAVFLIGMLAPPRQDQEV